MASLCALTLLPLNSAAAEEVSAEENPTEVLPSDYEEGNLDYLTLVDSFVTAERIPTSRFDTPANVIVITAEEIEANHYKSIGEILNHVPGIFSSEAINGTGESFGAHINASSRILVLTDGVRREFFPPVNMIERVEIVKGGGSALYGTDAVGGVINIITKKGVTNQTTLDFSFGSWKTRNYEFSNEGVEGKFNWFASGNFLSQDKISIAPANFSPDLYVHNSLTFDSVNNHDLHKFAANLSYDFTDRESLEMFLLYNKNHFGYFPDHRGSNEGHEIVLTYDFKKGTSTPGFFKYYNVRQESNYDNNLIGDEERTIFGGDQRQRIQNLQYQNGWEFGKHKLIAGLEYYRIDRNSWYWDYNEKKLTNMAYYLQDTISPDDKWTIIPGVRLDHNNAFGNKWSPKIAANYRADEKTKIFASWGNVYRAPDMRELYSSAYRIKNGRTLWSYLGNRSLKPESGHTETIGIEHNFNDDTNIRANIFNTKMKDFIMEFSDVGLGYDSAEDWYYFYDKNQYDNSPSLKLRGFEIEFQQKINDHFQYDLGYVYSKSKTVLNHSGSWGQIIPKNAFYLGLHYADGPFKANLYGRGVSGSADDLMNWAKKSYFTLDANVSYDIADWSTIYLAFNNIANKNYSVSAITAPGRFFMAGALFKF